MLKENFADKAMLKVNRIVSSPDAASLFFLPEVLQVKQASAGGRRSSAKTSTRQRGRREQVIWVQNFILKK